MKLNINLIALVLWIITGLFTLSQERVTKPLYILVWISLLMALICNLSI